MAFDPDRRIIPNPNEAEALRNRERTAAANALIEWFNGQEIKIAEAEAIMLKVQAKLLCARTRPDVFALEEVVDRHTTDLIHEMNERLHAIRRGK